MLLAEIVALVLICARIDGAAQQKNYQQAGMGSARKGIGWLLDEPKDEIREAKGGQRQTVNMNHPGGNVVALGANGEAEVAFKIDLSLFVDILNKIPNLQQALFNLTKKVDTLIYYVQDGDGRSGGGISSRMIALEQSVMDRIQQQETKINSMYEVTKQLHGELRSINQGIDQILTTVERLGGGGSGGICAQEMLVIQNLSQQMMNILTQILETVQRNEQGPGQAVSTNILEIVKQAYALLQSSSTATERISQQVSQIGQCPQKGGSATEIKILQEMSSVMSSMQNIPQQILVALQNSGILRGSTEALTQYVQQIIQICESIRNEVITVRNTLKQSNEELRRYFAENYKSLTAVRKVVTETTEIVQSSAAAAISASRSLRCPTRNQKPDLED